MVDVEDGYTYLDQAKEAFDGGWYERAKERAERAAVVFEKEPNHSIAYTKALGYIRSSQRWLDDPNPPWWRRVLWLLDGPTAAAFAHSIAIAGRERIGW